MNVELKEIITKKIEVKNLKELVEAIGAKYYGYFAFETGFGGNYGDHIFYFARIIHQGSYNGIVDDPLICAVTWAAFSLEGQEISSTNLEEYDVENIIKAATNLYEYKTIYHPLSINTFEKHIDDDMIDASTIENWIKSIYQEDLENCLKAEQEAEREFEDLNFDSPDGDLQFDPDSGTYEHYPDWLGGAESEEDFWEHTE